MNQIFAGFVSCAEHAPAFSGYGVVAETTFIICQRLLRGVGIMQAQLLPFFPYLKCDAAGILVQQGRMFCFKLVEIVRCLDDQQRGSLCQIRIQHLVEFLARIILGESGRTEPDQRDCRQGQGQQPLFERCASPHFRRPCREA